MQNTIALSLPISSISRIRINLKALWIFGFIFILSVLAVSILQINFYSKEVYLIHNYEQKIAQLTKLNKALEIDFSKVNSLGNVGSYVQNNVFVKTDKVEYISLLEGTALAK